MDIQTLKRLMRYESTTGKLFWLERDESVIPLDKIRKNWNTRFKDKEAFTSIDTKGYLRGTLFNKNHRAHRICWALYYGDWPQGSIDHINGDKTDNRIKNLRDVSHQENMTNLKRSSNNTSGFKGVSHTKEGNWRAYITNKGKRKVLGTFKTKEEAAKVRKAAEVELGYVTRLP